MVKKRGQAEAGGLSFYISNRAGHGLLSAKTIYSGAQILGKKRRKKNAEWQLSPRQLRLSRLEG